MTTLTQMERTATGWKCPRCGTPMADTLMPVRSMECNCYGLDIPPVLRKGWMSEETAKASERERLEAVAATTPEALAAEVGVPLKAALEAIQAARRALDETTGVPDAFRYALGVTMTAEQLRTRYPRKP